MFIIVIDLFIFRIWKNICFYLFSMNEPSGSRVQELTSSTAERPTITPPSSQTLHQTSESGASSSTEGCNSSERTSDSSHSNQGIRS